uniref:Uncharacterized protein n=1 Tax=Anopheles atroparvus TaxID=41427 RepID=A0A182J5E3_ANOAO
MGSEHSAQLQQAQQAGGADGAGGALRTGSLHRHSTTTPPASARFPIGANASGAKLQRGNTIAVTGGIGPASAGGGAGSAAIPDDGYSTSSATPSSAYICDSRPVSPPMSVCSDSDLPYISYTDKPIGGRDVGIEKDDDIVRLQVDTPDEALKHEARWLTFQYG